MQGLNIYQIGNMTTISKYNRLIVGLIPGIIVPIITLIIFFLFKSGVSNFFDYVHFMIRLGVFSSILSLCPLPNLAVFFFFLNKSYYYSARGVILATFIWVLIVFVYRYLIN
jgi:hypothetical protein